MLGSPFADPLGLIAARITQGAPLPQASLGTSQLCILHELAGLGICLDPRRHFSGRAETLRSWPSRHCLLDGTRMDNT